MPEKHKIGFFNTYNLVVPLLEDLVINLNKSGFEANAYVLSKDTDKDLQHFYFLGKSKKSKFYDSIIYCFLSIKKLLTNKFDTVVFFTHPPLSFLIYSLFKTKKTVFILHVMDVYPNMLFELGYFSKFKFLKDFLKQISNNRLKKFDKIVVIGVDMKELFIKKGFPENKISILRNYSGYKSKNNKNKTNNFKITYSGNMGVPHYFDTIIKIIIKLKENKNFEFHFIGSGKRKHELIEAKNNNNLTNLTIHNRLNDNDFKSIVGSSNLHFISLRQNFKGISVPSKFYTSISMEIPVLYEGPENSEIFNYLRRNSDLGKSFINDNLLGIMNFILKEQETKFKKEFHGGSKINQQLKTESLLIYKKIIKNE